MKLTSNYSLNKYLDSENITIEACPHCKSKDFIKHGKYFGLQRYRCKNNNCLKSFTKKTLTAWSYSKKDLETWNAYIELIILGATLRECAKKLKISCVTSFYWRRKLLNIITSLNTPDLLENKVQMNKLMIKENFKGQRYIDTNERMIIHVVSAIDNNRNTLSLAVARGFITTNIVKNKIYTKIHEKAYVIAHGDRILKAISLNHNNRKNNVDELHNVAINFNLVAKIWLRKFKGVASKYLNTYLAWYISVDKIHNLNIFINAIFKYKAYKKCCEFSKTKLFKGVYF